jgi:methylglutaconyl-CoA hydratase
VSADQELRTLRQAVGDAQLIVDSPSHNSVTVWINRPQVRNAMDLPTHAALRRVCACLSTSHTIHTVFFRGAGRVFTAGADLSARSNLDPSQVVQEMSAMYRAVAELPQFTVALVEGVALGGGVGLAAACDSVIATEDASFGCPEIRYGLIPAVISPYILAAVGSRYARQLFMTGSRISAQRAREIGLVEEIVADSGALEASAVRRLTQMRSCAPQALREAKRLTELAHRPLSESLIGETIARTVARFGSDESREGLSAAREKRKPRWETE